ncbi:PTS sugar transporter subunit IIA [Streptobacillus felis]|uniref:Ascorbate-specific PTS system EIIA component n=1 Tax=Streptobacillus felis TaxID=1384509 RepID=A0A7Z0PHM0_9FUSO|nr:PTS sugar transporter subunit IIA [Streptobacillus felis]NYV28165.1 PTS sugar transporter subunit IIA [Streptobacillus felis]
MLFNKSNVVIRDSVENWEEAIRVAAESLVESNNIKSEYIDKMIESVNKLGFYIVLTDDIAMPHARPEDGVIETGVSFLKVNEAVEFGDTKLHLIFVLAAKDKDSHIDTIGDLLEIFQDDDKIENLKKANKLEDLIEVIKGGK